MISKQLLKSEFMRCNICGSCEFKSFGIIPRKNAWCKTCDSLERHRALYKVLQSKNLLLNEKKGTARCLHLAPERCVHDYLLQVYGTGYIATDINPNEYQHAKCIKLEFPLDFAKFPSDYFDLIVHNHVLEHIPGDFKSHIDEFCRLLSTNGIMAFTIPDSRILSGHSNTIDGGEFLLSDDDRLKIHGQTDHLKTFGNDLIIYLIYKFSSVELLLRPGTAECNEMIKNHNASGIIYFCQK